MGGYVIVSFGHSEDGGGGFVLDLRNRAIVAGWSITDLSPRTWIATTGPHTPRMQTVGPWILVGDVLHRADPGLSATTGEGAWSYERKMMARFWGRYVGVRLSNGRVDAVMRDPSGAMEAWTWEQDGLGVVASGAPEWLLGRLQPAWTINVDRLAQGLSDPLMSSGPLLLDGPVAVGAGTVQPLPATTAPTALWRPADFARRSLKPVEPTVAATRLRAAVDEAVAGLAGLSGPVAAEVSGGLDSSIVASSLATRGSSSIVLWLNAFGTTPGSDERRYVEALGETLGVTPTSVPHATGPLTEAGLDRISQDIRPGLNGLDIPHDLDWARRVSDAGAGALMTGKGGDSILLQGSTPDVFTDLWLERGWRALLARDTPRLAATNEVSVWSMVSKARRYRAADYRPPVRDLALLTPRRGQPVSHAWLDDCGSFGPAKMLQVAGVADSVFRHGSSLLTAAIDVRHPLCSQPVIETALAIPTPVLALGGRDRGLARHAFRDRLPALIAERRSKGDMTAIYGRMILDSLSFLRPWLIEGRLTQLGVIDRRSAERLLTEESLMWRGFYAAIIVAAAYEGWVRAWEKRLGRTAPSPRPPG